MEEPSFVVVPQGWQREIEGDTVYYISPDLYKLRSTEEVVRHLTSPGTCKCGLRCPFQVEEVFSFDAHILSLPDHVQSEEALTEGGEALTLCQVAGQYQYSESPTTKPCSGNEGLVPSALSCELSNIPRSTPKKGQVVPLTAGAKRPLPVDCTMLGSEHTKRVKVNLGELFCQQQQKQEQTVYREENPASASAAHSTIKRLIEKRGRSKQLSVGQPDLTSLLWLADVSKLLGKTLKQGKTWRREPVIAQKTKLTTASHTHTAVLPAFTQSMPIQPLNQQLSVSTPPKPITEGSNSHQILIAEEQVSNGSGLAGGANSDISLEKPLGETALSSELSGSNVANMEVRMSQMTTTNNELQSNPISVVNTESSTNNVRENGQPEGISPNRSNGDGNDALEQIHMSPAVPSHVSPPVDNEMTNAEHETTTIAEEEQTTTVPQSLTLVPNNQPATDEESPELEVSVTPSEISTPVVSDKQQTPTSECSTFLPPALIISPVKSQYDSPTKIALKEVEVKMNARLPLTPSKFRVSPSKDIAMRQFHIPIEPLSVCSSSQQQQQCSRRELRWLARNKLKDGVQSKQQGKNISCDLDSLQELNEKQPPGGIKTQISNVHPQVKDDVPSTTASESQPLEVTHVQCSNPSLSATSTIMSVSISTPSCTCTLTASSNLTTTCTPTCVSTPDAILSKPLTLSNSIPNIPPSTIVQMSFDSTENTSHSSTLESIDPVSNTPSNPSHSVSSAVLVSPPSDTKSAPVSIAPTNISVSSQESELMPPSPSPLYVSPFPLSSSPHASKCVPSSDKNVLCATTNSSEEGAIEPLIFDHSCNETTTVTTPASATTIVNDLLATSAAPNNSMKNSPPYSNAHGDPSVSADNIPTLRLSDIPVCNGSSPPPTSPVPMINSNGSPESMSKTHPSSRLTIADPCTAVEQPENEKQLVEPYHMEAQSSTVGDVLPTSDQPLVNYESPPASGKDLTDQVNDAVVTDIKEVDDLFTNSCDANVESNFSSEETSVETSQSLEDVQKPIIDVECTDNNTLHDDKNQLFEQVSSVQNTECDQAQDESQNELLVSGTNVEVNNPECAPNSEDPVAISPGDEEEQLAQDNEDDSSTSAIVTVSAQNRPESFASEIDSATISSLASSSCDVVGSFSTHSRAGSEHSFLQSSEDDLVESNSDALSCDSKVKNVSLIMSVDSLLEQIEQQKSSTSCKAQSKARSNSSSKSSFHYPVRRIQTRSRSQSESSMQSERNARSISVDVLSAESLPAELGDSSHTSSAEEPLNLVVSLPLSSIRIKHKSTTVLSCKPSTVEMGNIVWAKAAMLPGWPGKIISSSSKRKLKKAPIGKAWIEWIGDSTVSLVDIDAIKPLEEGIKLRRKGRNKIPKKLQLSIDMALELLQEQKK